MTVIIGDGGHARDIAALTHPEPELVDYHTHWDGKSDYIIGINDPHIRAHVSAELGGPGINHGVWMHPDAKVWESQIGQGVHVNYGARMVRTRVGGFTTISPGVTICGDVVIGRRCLIGAGATIADRVIIGDDCTIGAGACVLPATIIATGQTWVGVPARSVQ